MGKDNPFWTGRKAIFIFVMELVLFSRSEFMETMGALSYFGIPFIIMGLVPLSIIMAIINRVRSKKEIDFKKELKSYWNLIFLIPIFILLPENIALISNKIKIADELKRYYGKEFVIEKDITSTGDTVIVYTKDLPEVKAQIYLKTNTPNYWYYQAAYTEYEIKKILKDRLNQKEFRTIKERNERESKSYKDYSRGIYPTIEIPYDNKPQGKILSVNEVTKLNGNMKIEASLDFGKKDLEEDTQFILLYAKFLNAFSFETRLDIYIEYENFSFDIKDKEVTYETIKNRIEDLYKKPSIYEKAHEELKKYYGKDFVIEKDMDSRGANIYVHTSDLPQVKTLIYLTTETPNYWDYQVDYTKYEVQKFLDEQLIQEEFKTIKERDERESKSYKDYSRNIFIYLKILDENKPQGKLLNIEEVSHLRGDFTLEISTNFKKGDLDEDVKFILLNLKYLKSLPINAELCVYFNSHYWSRYSYDENITYEAIKNEIKGYY